MNFDPEKLERLPVDVPGFPGFAAWLDEKIEVQTFLGGTMKVRRWQRVFWLVVCNGGWKVHGWRIHGGGFSFPPGLEQHDAIELISFEAFLQGASYAVGQFLFDPLLPSFEKFVADVEAQAKALECVPDAGHVGPGPCGSDGKEIDLTGEGAPV